MSVPVRSSAQPTPRLRDFSPSLPSPGRGRGRACRCRLLVWSPARMARRQRSFPAQSRESRRARDPARVVKALSISGGRFFLSYSFTAALNVAVTKHTRSLLPSLKIAGLWGIPLRVTFHFPLRVFNPLNQNFNSLHSGTLDSHILLSQKLKKREKNMFVFEVPVFFCHIKLNVLVKSILR